jgi:hypothetical protein
MDTWRNVILQNFPEFGHHPKAWELADLARQLGELLWRAAQAGDDATVGRVVKFLVWAEEEGKHQEGLAWLCEDVLRHTLSAPDTRAALIAALDTRTLHCLKRAIAYLTSAEVLAEMEQGVRADKASRPNRAVAG